MKCVVHLYGRSASGKTTTIERAVRMLKEKGLAVAVVKHSHHELDIPGKDTYRYEEGGSDYVLYASKRCALFFKCDPRKVIDMLPVDVVLIEGFRSFNFGGVELEIRGPSQIDGTINVIMDRILSCLAKPDEGHVRGEHEHMGV
ncbi:MAG: molybdopterin-guanine dinucleotide biosynthesis protein B [Nitrososphaerota archaeon]|nr:molybdopterin-guanine dinucleotide biosynthesis protein B [Nitrososphaerota archaeon]